MSKKEVEKLSNEDRIKLVNSGNIFCIRKFLTGFIKKVVNFIFEIVLSAEFLVWTAFSIAFFFAMFKFSLASMMWIWLVYAGISIVFIIARSIRIVLEQKTTLELKMQASTSITGDLNQIAQQALDNIKTK